jgi:hypothetical protein
MATTRSVLTLRAALETQRLKAVERLAETSGPLSLESLQGVAILQVVLTAVREEIETHSIRLGRDDVHG